MKVETSRIFHVSVFFACKMKKLMDGKLAPLKRRGRSAKLTGAHVKWLIECLTEQPLMYLEEMQALLREKETDPIEVSKSTISRALKKAGFTKKKTQAIAKERESERVKELRRVYKEKMPSMNVHQMLFLDESGFNQKTKNRVRGWSHRGETVQSVQQYQKGQRYSLFAAIGLGSNGSRITTTMITKRNGNRIMFLKFLRKKVVPHLIANPNTTVVMDNCSIHKGEEVKQVISSAGGKILFLPPYSPDLNPIECAFSKTKAMLKKKYYRRQKVRKRYIRNSFNYINAQDIRGWIRHCGYTLPPLDNAFPNSSSSILEET